MGEILQDVLIFKVRKSMRFLVLSYSDE